MHHPPATSDHPSALVGRERVYARVCGLLDAGQTVLIYGPVGSGKTTLIEAIAARARKEGIPYGLSTRTDTLSDLTSALARAYPDVDALTGSKRRVRYRLRMKAETRRCLLLLDHIGGAGTIFKGTLKALRGHGIGVLIAADVEKPRDHDRARGLRLAFHELALPPLTASATRAVLAAALSQRTLPFPVGEEDLRDLVRGAEGLPGRAVGFAAALERREAWTTQGRPRTSWMRMEAVIAAAERYRKAMG
jgi:replication-associated recombination protein RarA